jgi:hypothetical protein
MQAIVSQPSVTGVPGPPPAPRMTTLMKAAPSARGSKPETTDSRAKRPECALHGVDQPIGEICGGDRAARRMARDSDDATLPEANVNPAMAASIGRHARPDTIEDAAERPRCRGSLRQIEPARHVVGIVPQVDGDARRLRVDANDSLDADALGRLPGEWVVHVLGRGGSCRQLADRRDHAHFAIVEPSPL